MRRIILFCLFFLFSFYYVDAAVKPQDFGLLSANNGVERYWALYNAHKEATRLGTVVDYSGIGNLSIEIPKDAKSIVINGSQDFNGLKLTVKNNGVKDFFLFVSKKKTKNIDISQSIIDGRDFRSIKELRDGVRLLLIRDANLWVENRAGHDYGAERRDVLLLINGIAQNSSVMPYGNKGVSVPICRYVESDLKKKILGNISFIRTADSKYKTFLIWVANVNNIELFDIQTFTPKDDEKYADAIIFVQGSTNVTYRNINIIGMYTQPDKVGYGVSMDNIWNVKLYNVRGNVPQGLICNSNINQSYLKNCHINRYDIHCYGRDAIFEDCTFKGMYFPVASFYGKIVFRRCSFDESQPVWLRSDYNAYVPFDIELYDCSWYPVKGRDAICYTGKLDKTRSSRKELIEKCWPSVKIRGLDVYPSDELDAIYVYRVGGGNDLNQAIGYMPFIDVKGLNVHSRRIKFKCCNRRINPINKTVVSIKQARQSKATVHFLKLYADGS